MAIYQQCSSCKKVQALKNKRCRKCGQDLDKAKASKRTRYWVNFYVGKKEKRELVGYSIEDARAADGKRRAQKKENRIFEILPIGDITLEELAKWFKTYEQERVDSGEISAGYLEIKLLNLKTFNSEFGERQARDITAEDLNQYKAKRKKEGLSDSYIDDLLESAKSMIKTAFAERKVDGETLRIFSSCKKLLKKGSNARDKVISYEDYQSPYLGSPIHIKPVVAAAYWTGMRKGEILNLTWDRIDLSIRMIRLKAADVKEGLPKRIPLPRCLRDILLQVPGRGSDDYVFQNKGKPFSDLRNGLKVGCKAAGIPYGRNTKDGFTFHDLRHSAKTNARKADVDNNIRMVMFGHSDSNDMDLRYDRVDDQDLLTAADQIEAFLNADQMLTKIAD